MAMKNDPFKTTTKYIKRFLKYAKIHFYEFISARNSFLHVLMQYKIVNFWEFLL